MLRCGMRNACALRKAEETSVQDWAQARARMVERQIAARGITDPAILEAFASVPRELFVAEGDKAGAYDDNPLPIEAGQTISQPYMVALMIAAARVGPESHVLEVGAGSGYAAALIGRIVRRVVAIERHEVLARQAAERLRRLSCQNVRLLHGDGMAGCAEEAPFDAIIVSAAATEVPEALCAQLAAGGRLVVPVGPQDSVQQLVRISREAEGFRREQLAAVRFVPLVQGLGEEG